MNSSIRWAEIPADDDGDNGEETEAHGAVVDESVAERRLRRWLKGMFGGGQEQKPEPPEREPEG
jgi:hypothetical protein